jgi:hypothetical protein
MARAFSQLPFAKTTVDQSFTGDERQIRKQQYDGCINTPPSIEDQMKCASKVSARRTRGATIWLVAFGDA